MVAPIHIYFTNSILSETRRLTILQTLAEEAARLYGIDLPQYEIIAQANKIIDEFLAQESGKE